MPNTYSTIDKTDWIYQPNYVRRRHKYRSPMESLKFNQGDAQFRYDIFKIEQRLNINATTITTYGTNIVNGATVSGVTYVTTQASGLLKSALLYYDPQYYNPVDETAKNMGTGGSAFNLTLGPNTKPCRIKDGALYITSTGGTFANDASWLDVTGDIELVARVALDDYTNGADQPLIAKWNTTNNTRSYMLNVSSTGFLQFIYSTDGSTAVTRTSTVVAPFTDTKAYWIKATFDVNNGSGSNEVKFFYTADATLEPYHWTQLGSTVTNSGTVTMFNGSSRLHVGGHTDFNATEAVGKFYRAIVRNGIAGTSVFDADFTGYVTGTKTVYDTAKNHQFNITSDFTGPVACPKQSQNYFYFPGSLAAGSNYLSVPDTAALDITNNLDISMRVALDYWQDLSNIRYLVSKFVATGNQRSFNFYVDIDGTLNFNWSANGTATILATSSDKIKAVAGTTLWLRVTFAGSAASGGREVKFYTAPDSLNPPTAWTQLGTTQTGASSSIFVSTANVEIGSQGNTGTSSTLRGDLYRVIMRNGIDGQSVLDINPSTITNLTATSFTESASGFTVTINRATGGLKMALVTRPIMLFGSTSNGFLTLADNNKLDLGTTDSMTAVVAVRRWATQAAAEPIISKRTNQTAGAANKGWMLYYSTGGAVRFGIADGAAETTAIGSALNAGQIYTVVGRRDTVADTVASVLDGTVTSSTDATTTSLDNTFDFRIGCDSGTGSTADFELFGAAFFNRALTTSEISQVIRDMGSSTDVTILGQAFTYSGLNSIASRIENCARRIVLLEKGVS